MASRRRPEVLALLAVLSLGCAKRAPHEEKQVSPPYEAKLTNAQLELQAAMVKDLSLVVTATTSVVDEKGNVVEVHDKVETGYRMKVLAELVNTSKTRSYVVVHPNLDADREEVEPYVPISLEPGGPIKINREESPLDADWHRRAKTLAPGARTWVGERDLFYRSGYLAAGKYRIVARYRYARGRFTRELPPRPLPPALMDVPPFELSSAPIEIELTRPIDVVVAARTAMKAGVATEVAKVLDIRVVNRSGSKRKLEGRSLFFRVTGGAKGATSTCMPASGSLPDTPKVSLEPNAALSMLDTDAFGPKKPIGWTCAQPGRYQVSVGYDPRGEEFLVWSAPVEIEVTP